jgi:hypothetical protein
MPAAPLPPPVYDAAPELALPSPVYDAPPGYPAPPQGFASPPGYAAPPIGYAPPPSHAAPPMHPAPHGYAASPPEEPEEEDIFGVHTPAAAAPATSAKPQAAATPATPNPDGSNQPAAPLSLAERRALQKRKQKMLLFACLGIFLLLAGGGGAYFLLRDPNKPVAKSGEESSKDGKDAAAGKTVLAKKTDDGKAAPAVEPLIDAKSMTAVTPAVSTPPVPVKAKEITARIITMRMEHPVLQWHLAGDGAIAAVATAKGEVDGYGLIKTARLWSYEDPIGIGMPWKISSVAFSNAASTDTKQALLLVSGNLMVEDLFLVALDSKDGKEMGQYRSIKGPASFMQFHPMKPNLLLVGLNNATGSLQLLNLNEDKPVAELLDAHESAIQGMAISADGARCVTTSTKMVEGKEQPASVLTIWSLTEVGREREYTEFAGTLSAVTISPDGKLLAVHESGAETGTIHVLSFPELEPVAKIPGAPVTVPAGQQLHAFLPTDDALAVAMGQDVAFFNARTGEKRAVVPKLFTDKPHSLLVSADGKTILTSSGAKEFKLAKLP